MCTIGGSESSAYTSHEYGSLSWKEFPSSGDSSERRGHVRTREELRTEIVEPSTKKFPFTLEQPTSVGFQLFPQPTNKRGEKTHKSSSQKGANTSVSLQRSYETLLAIHTWVAEDRSRLLLQRDHWLLERSSLIQQISQLQLGRGISTPFSNPQPVSVRLDQGPVFSTILNSGGFKNLECTEVEVKFTVSIPSTSKPSVNTQKEPVTPPNSPEIL